MLCKTHTHTHTHTGEIIGFTDLGKVDEEIANLGKEPLALEDSIATHMLTFMVRGIFNKVNFPLAHFPTKGIKGGKLYPIVWRVVRALQRIGLKVHM